MGYLLAVLLLSVSFVGVGSFNRTRHVKRQSQPLANKDFIISTPDLIAKVKNKGVKGHVIVQAFKNKHNDQILLEIPSNPTKAESLTFLSIGSPKIEFPFANPHGTKLPGINALVLTPHGFYISVQMLRKPYQKALAAAANVKYHTSVRIKPTQIMTLTPDSFTCVAKFAISNVQTDPVRGKADNLYADPIIVDFELSDDSIAYQKLRSGSLSSDAVAIECEIVARANQVQHDQLVITSDQIDQLNLRAELFGTSEKVFVARMQLNKLAREVMQKLHIHEQYETGGFESNFVTEFLSKFGVQGALTPKPIEDALKSLSKYNIKGDLKADEIIKELSEVLKIETIGNKEQVVSNNESSLLIRGETNDSGGASVSGSASGLVLSFEAAAAANYATAKSNEWANSAKTARDQLKDINKHSKSAVKFELVGSKIIPKSLDVAEISKSQLSQSMSFSRIRQKLTAADFRRHLRLRLPNSNAELLTTTTADGSNTPIATTTTLPPTTSTTSTTTETTTTTTTTATTRDRCEFFNNSYCERPSDCCNWNYREFKMYQSCGEDHVCGCVAPGKSCHNGWRCCDGSFCNGYCRPTFKFHYCHTALPYNCQWGLTCTVDSVSLRIFVNRNHLTSGRCI